MEKTDFYSVFRKFPDEGQAKELAIILEKNGIDCIIEDNSPALDITFAGNTLQNQTEVKIKQSDFLKANEILEQESENLANQVDRDHYLFAFTDEELYEILIKSDEWSPFDYKLAQKILKKRGKEVNPELLNTLKKQRIEELSQPEPEQGLWIKLGYILSLLGGIIGIFIGWYLWTSKKTLPNGQKVYLYNDRDRKNGRKLFIVGMIIFAIVFVLKLTSKI